MDKRMMPLFLAVLIFVFICSCAPTRVTPIGLEGKTVSSQVKETWGFGCGKDCTFNSDGSDTTEFVFGQADAVWMNNTGRYVNVVHYPHSFILDAKKWNYDYKGVWSITEDGIEVRVSLVKSECSVQRSEGRRRVKLACERPLPSRLFICKIDRIKISDDEKDALICRDEGGDEIVFGVGAPIVKVFVGEPSIKTHFYSTKSL